MKTLTILAPIATGAAFLLVRYFDWRAGLRRRILGEHTAGQRPDPASKEVV